MENLSKLQPVTKIWVILLVLLSSFICISDRLWTTQLPHHPTFWKQHCADLRSLWKTLLISHRRPLLEFASPEWNTGYLADLRLLESVRRWSKRTDELADVPYFPRLKVLDLFSVKGRLLRAALLKCWNIFHGKYCLQPQDIFILLRQEGPVDTKSRSPILIAQRDADDASSRLMCWCLEFPPRRCGWSWVSWVVGLP